MAANLQHGKRGKRAAASRLTVLISMICMICFLTACTSDIQQMEPRESSLSSEEHHDSDALNNPAKDIHAAYPSADILRKYDPNHIYYYPEKTDSATAALWTDKPVKDFCLIEIDYIIDDNNVFRFFQTDVLYALDDFSPSDLLVVNTIIPEGIPSWGIAFTDENNTRRYFSAQWIGHEGAWDYLVEFSNYED